MSGINTRRCCCEECIDCESKTIIFYARDWYTGSAGCADAHSIFDSYIGAEKHTVTDFFVASGITSADCDVGTITIPELLFTFNPDDYFQGTCWFIPGNHNCPTSLKSLHVNLKIVLLGGKGSEPTSPSNCISSTKYSAYVNWGACVNASNYYPPKCLAHSRHTYDVETQTSDRIVTVHGPSYTLHLPEDGGDHYTMWAQPLITVWGG